MNTSRFAFTALLAASILPIAACSGPYDASEQDLLEEAASAIKVCPGPVTTKGIDVSHWQGNINWTSVKNAGVKFAFMKATESNYYKDDTFAANWAGSKANGILRGAYHFFRGDVDGVVQADYFLAKMGPLEPTDMPPVLDFETTDGAGPDTLANRALAFLQRVEQKTGRTPIIYAGYYFWKDNVTHLAEFKKYPLWLPYYVNDPATQCPLVYEGTWDKFTIWQYTSTGSVSGIGGDVDMNFFDGSLADLTTFISGTAPAPLPGQITGNDAMTFVNWPQDNHAEVFVTTKAGDLVHTWSKGAADDWNPFDTIDGGAMCGLAAGYWPAPKSTAEVFSPKAGGTTQHSWFDPGVGWNAFQDLGGKGLSKLSTLTWPDGHMEVFGLGDDGAIWHNYFVEGAGWSDWQSMGGSSATGVSPIVWGDGHAELLITDKDGNPWLNFSGNFPGGWFGWLMLDGKLASKPIPVRWPDGHIELFGLGVDGVLQHALFDGQKWGSFTAISPGTKIEGQPSVFMNPGDKGSLVVGPEVVARDTSGKVVHLWWDGAAYSDFMPLFDQATASDPFGWMRSDGFAEVFAIDKGGELVRTYRSDKGWQAWASLGGGDLNPCVPGGDTGEGGGGAGGAPPKETGSGGSQTGAGAGGADANAVDGGADAGCACEAAGQGAGGPPTGFLMALLPLMMLRRKRR